jgi:hypothetical protein
MDWLTNPGLTYLLERVIVVVNLPKLDNAIPTSRDQEELAILGERVHIFDRLRVLSNCLWLILRRVNIIWIPHFDGSI